MASSATVNATQAAPGGRWVSGLAAAVVVLAFAGCSDGARAKADSAPAADAPSAPATPPAPVIDDDTRADRYLAIRSRLDADPDAAPSGPEIERIRAELESIANEADDAHLRANAALLLGSLLEQAGDPAAAIQWYRHAVALVPDDAGPRMALAVALASAGQYEDAGREQAEATRLDPDNLENWLALGELRVRAGDHAGATEAYVGYERRRKGLIDGLTGRVDDRYVVSADERIACAQALASAADTGTAFALLYALQTEPDAPVRAAIAEVMGIQRLDAYTVRLRELVGTELDSQAKAAMQWALAEIERAPVSVAEGERARLAADDPRKAAPPATESAQNPEVGSPPPPPAGADPARG